MPHKLGLLDSRHGIKHFFPPNALAQESIDGEIAHAEAREVLEEMGALAGVDAVVFESCLDNEFRGTDVRPFHRDAQPIVTRPPASWSHEHIPFSLIEETTVELLYLTSDGGVIGGREMLIGLDIHHIADLLIDAMAERHVRTEQAVFISNRGEVGLEHLLGIDNRTDL